MRLLAIVTVAWVAGCGSSGSGDVDAAVLADGAVEDAPRVVDAAPSDAATIDAAPDAEPDAACETVLLIGGSDVAAQGWAVNSLAPAVTSYGADYTELATSTTAGAVSGGTLLISHAAVQPGQAFALEVQVMITAVNAHNQFDAAAAIMGSFTAPFGAGADRAEMIYLDANAIGWADDTQTHAVALADGAYHVIVLAVDAAGAATVTVDGVAALERAGYVTSGTIALGDQTNDKNVDGTIRIRSVKLLCL